MERKINNDIDVELLYKKSKRKKIILVVSIILLVLVVLSSLYYFLIYKNDDEKELESNSITQEEANKYYSYISSNNLFSSNSNPITLNKDGNWNDSINVSEISANDKLIYAYKQLTNDEVTKGKCSSHREEIVRKVDLSQNACGPMNKEVVGYECEYDDIGNRTKCNYTDVINEEVLKNKVEMIFGKDSYESVYSFGYGPDYYYYDSENKQYFLGVSIGGRVGPMAKSTFMSAYKNDSEIVIITTEEYYPNSAKFKHTFLKSNDGNYYYNNSKKI